MIEFSLVDVFTDGMVIQQNMPLRVYGNASDNTKIGVSIDNLCSETVCKNGSWEIVISSVTVGGPYNLEILVDKIDKYVIHDILCGDVFIASGQSNMDMPLCSAENTEEVLNSIELFNVRIYDVPHWPYKGCNNVSDDFKRICPDKFNWRNCTKEQTMNFSAVGYYFARRLREDTGIPIGIINCSWSGTAITSWMPEEAPENDIDIRKDLDDYRLLEGNLDLNSYNTEFNEYINKFEEYINYGSVHVDNINTIPYPMPPMGPKSYERPCGLYHSMLDNVIRFNVKGTMQAIKT
jgi:sialate O-acetylesterase